MIEGDTPVWFTEWATVLDGEPFDGVTRERYRRSVVGYLHHLKTRRLRASLTTAKAYVEDGEARGMTGAEDREALRWFFRAAARRDRPALAADMESAPSPIQPEKADLGRTPWEKRLIERLRVGQYQWRTETTYRDWIWRFVAWLGERPVEEATGADIKAFLSYLAVDRSVAASTQRQALNALVFFFREVLKREPGDLADYTPSSRAPRVPVVLTRDECRHMEPLRATHRRRPSANQALRGIAHAPVCCASRPIRPGAPRRLRREWDALRPGLSDPSCPRAGTAQTGPARQTR